MKQCHYCKENGFSASLQILHISWNSKVDWRVRNCSSFFAMVRHIYQFHALPFHLFKIHFILYFILRPIFQRVSFFFRLPHQNPVFNHLLLHTLSHAPSTSSFFILFPNNICRAVKIMELLVTQFFFQHPFISSLFGPDISNIFMSQVHIFSPTLFTSSVSTRTNGSPNTEIHMLRIQKELPKCASKRLDVDLERRHIFFLPCDSQTSCQTMGSTANKVTRA